MFQVEIKKELKKGKLVYVILPSKNIKECPEDRCNCDCQMCKKEDDPAAAEEPEKGAGGPADGADKAAEGLAALGGATGGAGMGSLFGGLTG